MLFTDLGKLAIMSILGRRVLDRENFFVVPLLHFHPPLSRKSFSTCSLLFFPFYFLRKNMDLKMIEKLEGR